MCLPFFLSCCKISQLKSKRSSCLCKVMDRISKQNQPGGKADASTKQMSLTGHWVPQSCRPPHGLVLWLTVHQAKAGTLSTGQWVSSVLPVGQPCHHCNYSVGCCLCLCLSLHPPQTCRDDGECGSAVGNWFESQEILPTPSPFFPRQGNHSAGLWGNRSRPVRQYSHPSTWFHYPFLLPVLGSALPRSAH